MNAIVVRSTYSGQRTWRSLRETLLPQRRKSVLAHATYFLNRRLTIKSLLPAA